MKIAAALLALACGGCSMGQPASLAPASRQAIAPVQTFGFNPVVRQGIGIPVGAAKCVTGFVTRGLTDAVQTLDCVLDALIPIVTPPQSVIQTAPQSAPCGPVAPRKIPRAGVKQKRSPSPSGPSSVTSNRRWGNPRRALAIAEAAPTGPAQEISHRDIPAWMGLTDQS